MIERDAVFRRPTYFEDKLKEVKKKVASRNVQFSTPSYAPVSSAQQNIFSSMMMTGNERHNQA